MLGEQRFEIHPRQLEDAAVALNGLTGAVSRLELVVMGPWINVAGTWSNQQVKLDHLC